MSGPSESGSEKEDRPGFVYILKNEAMPGFIKIGLTRENDVEARLRSLDNTSVPLPFTCYFTAKVPDCAKLERTLHFVFGEKRARLRREFFQTDPDLVKAIIELVALNDPAQKSIDEARKATEAAISPQERDAIERTLSARAARRTFEALGIEPGATLTFAKDASITCTVADDRFVTFRGKKLTPSGAARIVIAEMGYEWPTISGSEYWMFEGRKLAALERIGAQELLA